MLECQEFTHMLSTGDRGYEMGKHVQKSLAVLVGIA